MRSQSFMNVRRVCNIRFFVFTNVDVEKATLEQCNLTNLHIFVLFPMEFLFQNTEL